MQHWLIDAIEGNPSPEAMASICKALRAWWMSAGQHGARGPQGIRKRSSRLSLARCAGLPESPERARIEVRDWYLREAAGTLGVSAAKPWLRALELHRAVQAFLARKWGVWCQLEAPPGYASQTEVFLWHAARASFGDLPGTARRYRQILQV